VRGSAMPMTEREDSRRGVGARLALAAGVLLVAAATPAGPGVGSASVPADTGGGDKGDDGGGAGRVPGECGFVSAAETGSATGVTWVAVEGTYTDAARGRCRFYTDPSKKKGGFLQLDVAGDDADIWAAAHKVFGRGGDLPGLGDKAYWDKATNLLDILKGTTRVSVLIAGDDDWLASGPSKAEAVKLAQIVLPRVDGSET
jgi:hypothetical protein